MSEKNPEVITTPETTDLLTKIDGYHAAAIYTDGGVEPILAMIKAEVENHTPDTTTSKGRKEIASLANKVSRAKVSLDDAGKDLVADWKQKAKAVDVVRKDIRDRLDLLKIEARKPLTEWEEEQQRIKDQERIDAENELARLKLQAEINQAEVEAYAEDAIRTQAIEQERIAEEQRKVQEDLDRQKKEIEDQKQKLIDEENERIQEAAYAEKRRLQAEQGEKDRIEREQREAEAELERKKLEEDRIEQARLQAIEDEKNRQADVAAMELKEKLKREENKRIRTRTHNQIAASIIMLDEAGWISEDAVDMIVGAIADGKIPKVSITY